MPMVNILIRLICAGRLREKYYIEAFEEYSKRLGAFIKFECVEISEQKTGDTPSAGEIAKALEKETRDILKQIPEGAYTILAFDGEAKADGSLGDYAGSHISVEPYSATILME